MHPTPLSLTAQSAADSTTVGAPAHAGPAPLAVPPAGQAWSSEQLFGGRTEIEIIHGPHRYRLRQTSLGKLILTK